jgi:hypothetical protein
MVRTRSGKVNGDGKAVAVAVGVAVAVAVAVAVGFGVVDGVTEGVGDAGSPQLVVVEILSSHPPPKLPTSPAASSKT